MKKQMLLSFLAGAVVPLVLAGIFQKTPALPDAESESISPTVAGSWADAVGLMDSLSASGRAGLF